MRGLSIELSLPVRLCAMRHRGARRGRALTGRKLETEDLNRSLGRWMLPFRSKDGNRKYKGTVHCLYVIYRTAGVAGWFRGMIAKLWQTVLTAAFQLMTFEYIRAAVMSAAFRLRSQA